MIDVLIIGGGPAGATIATLAAGDGLSVVVLERTEFPRHKVCGEFVASRGVAVLERLGVLDSLTARGATRIERCLLSTPRGRVLDTVLPEPGSHALGVSRAVLDDVLLAEAARRGADVRFHGHAYAPLFREDRVSGVSYRTRRSLREHRIEARVVIAADGRRSMLSAALHPEMGDPRRSNRCSRFGLGSHFEGGSSTRRVELHLFDGGYAGLAPIEDGRLNVCMLATVAVLRRAGGSPERLLEERLRTNPALERSLAGARSGRPWHSIGPLRFAPRRPAARGALFAGDAAGTIDPFCGAGITHALGAGELLHGFVREAIARSRLTPEIERAYTNAWRLRFAPPSRRVRRLGWLFERPRLAAVVATALDGPARALLPRWVHAARPG